jgi:predicted nuclease with TOPRIM domain
MYLRKTGTQKSEEIPGMKTVEEHINSINTKLQQLLKKYAALRKENTILSHELEERRTNEKQYLDRIDALEMQAGILKASSGMMTGKDKQDFEKRINQYIKDLEKCIAMLNN